MKELLWYLIIVIVVIAICAFLTELIWNSDMPFWLKWFLLK